MKNQIEYSVVVPVMNEEENVELLYNRITETLKPLRKRYEIIMVDDGSTDETFNVLKTIHRKDRNLKVIKFRRNFGQSAAMAAGFERAKGKVVVSMDGDLQNDPKDIPAMVEKLDEGYDIIAGWRKNRKDKVIIRKTPSKIANRIMRFLTGVQLHDTGCSLKVYRSEIIQKMRLYGEMHRFIPALARIEGARISEMVVAHHARQFGQSKYNITRTFRVILDLTTLNFFIKYLNRPMHFFGMIGFAVNTLGLAMMIYSLWMMANGVYDLEEVNVSLSVAFLMLTSGCLFVFFGLIASLIINTGDKKNSRLMEYFTKTR